MARASAHGTIAVSASFDLGEERKVLEWKPRLITVLLVLALFAVAFAAGYFEFVVDNWEW
jgi:hypothetical protein